MRPGHLSLLSVATMAALLVASNSPRAAEISGVTLPGTEMVEGNRLTLKACAVREELWTNLYAVSVYLLPQANVSQAALSNTPKLVRIDVTYDGQVPNGLPSGWKMGLQQQVSHEFIQRLQGLYNDLKGGDTVQVSYVPNGETKLSVNGRIVATRPGDTVFNAMMQLWIGNHPVSQNIKHLLLDGRC